MASAAPCEWEIGSSVWTAPIWPDGSVDPTRGRADVLDHAQRARRGGWEGGGRGSDRTYLLDASDAKQVGEAHHEVFWESDRPRQWLL